MLLSQYYNNKKHDINRNIFLSIRSLVVALIFIELLTELRIHEAASNLSDSITVNHLIWRNDVL